MSSARSCRFFALVLLGLLSATPAALPQQSLPARYEVEILVFRMDGELPLAPPESLRTEPDAVQATPVAQRRLADAAGRLRAAGGFRIIAHTAWTQAPAAWNSRRGVPVSTLGLEGSGLTGTVILERGQYLHLGFDLRYGEGSNGVLLNEVRRVKINERQYFDHPAVGIIALVTPATGS